jgi:hypothetical protein
MQAVETKSEGDRFGRKSKKEANEQQRLRPAKMKAGKYDIILISSVNSI